MALMVSLHSDDEENGVNNLELSYDELHNVFLELHAKCLNLSRTYSKQKKIIITLDSKASDMKVELEQIKNSAYNKCHSHESKIIELNQVIKKYEKVKLILKIY